jgi:hypothetical protein
MALSQPNYPRYGVDVLEPQHCAISDTNRRSYFCRDKGIPLASHCISFLWSGWRMSLSDYHWVRQYENTLAEEFKDRDGRIALTPDRI